MDPWASQQAAVRGVNVHDLKGNLTGVRAYLYRKVNLSPNLSASAVEGRDYHGTWL